ncbi:hypothetical protein [Herpetosiphon gulosus]|uniref:Plus3 domain-containing protein n=1 Tax=Herpetosiphon gulosus TaxID=1973496 RepID=A0ABP9X6E5_9CHLR
MPTIDQLKQKLDEIQKQITQDGGDKHSAPALLQQREKLEQQIKAAEKNQLNNSTPSTLPANNDEPKNAKTTSKKSSLIERLQENKKILFLFAILATVAAICQILMYFNILPFDQKRDIIIIVIDQETNTPINNATVVIDNTTIINTDTNGNATVSISKDKNSIIIEIKADTYNSIKAAYNINDANNRLEIKLTKTTSQPTGPNIPTSFGWFAGCWQNENSISEIQMLNIRFEGLPRNKAFVGLTTACPATQINKEFSATPQIETNMLIVNVEPEEWRLYPKNSDGDMRLQRFVNGALQEELTFKRK